MDHVKTKAQASRGKSLEKLFSGFEHQPAGVMVCSLAQCLTEVGQWRIEYVNPAWCRVTGKPFVDLGVPPPRLSSAECSRWF